MNLEELLHFGEDIFEAASFVSRWRRFCVPMHSVANPKDISSLRFYGLNQSGEVIAYFSSSDTCDEGDTARLIVRIEDFKKLEQVISCQGRTTAAWENIGDEIAAPEGKRKWSDR